MDVSTENRSVPTGGKCQVSSWCCQRNLLPCSQPGPVPTAPSVLLRIQKAVLELGSPQGTAVIRLLRRFPRKERISRDSFRASSRTVLKNAINWGRWVQSGWIIMQSSKNQKALHETKERHGNTRIIWFFFLTEWRLLNLVKTSGKQINWVRVNV